MLLLADMSIDLTLHRIQDLLSCFESYRRPTVHIAGTNGKGSVSAFLSHIFTQAGLKVGRFNSPHLLEVQDCISIDNESVGKINYESVTKEITDVNTSKAINASNFEVLTVTALVLFERSAVDIVVCEVGLGGRLDATNVIPDEAILISVITSIDLDHQAFLGSTVSAIAREKAGIIRRHTPVVLSTQKHEEVIGVVEDTAKAVEADLILGPLTSDREWDVDVDGPHPDAFSLSPSCPPPGRPVDVLIGNTKYKLLLPLHGDHQLSNLGTAIAVFHKLREDASAGATIHGRLSRLDTTKLYAGVRNTKWPGRLSFYTHTLADTNSSPFVILVDGAHNEAASTMLASYISGLLTSLSTPSIGPVRKISLTYILALSHSPPKTPESVLLPLLALPLPDSASLDVKTSVAFLRFTPPAGMPWVKSVSPSLMADIAKSDQGGNREWNVKSFSEEPMQDAKSELQAALHWAVEQSESELREMLVVVAGSLYLVADLLRLLRP